MTRPGIEPRSPGPLANTLTPRPMSGICSVSGYAFFRAKNSHQGFVVSLQCKNPAMNESVEFFNCINDCQTFFFNLRIVPFCRQK